VSDKTESGFVSLKSLKGQAPRSPGDIIAEIRGIYFKTSKQTVQNDLIHAIELLKSLPDEETRDRAAVYMEGIAQMRKEWLSQGGERKKEKGKRKKENNR